MVAKSSALMSQYFLPTLREDPAEAAIISHRYMLRAGLIRQSTSGIYSWLPLGLKVLKKIEEIVREEQNRASFIEMLMPTIQPSELWQQSERYDSYGKEMLRIQDRHGRDLLYGPTNEEVITDIIAQNVSSYKQLPLVIYQIQWKFRDEIRPRFGVMRGREFLMKDGYSFDSSTDAAEQTYYKVFASYLRIFARLNLKPIPMRAETGPIGGNKSHEFIVLAPTGESTVYCHADLLEFDPLKIKGDDDRRKIFDDWTKLYAATEDMHEPEKFETHVPKDKQIEARGIEVGHIFYFGDKYAKPLRAEVNLPDGKNQPLLMGSYGIGVSRLVGALIEAFHDDKGIIWPESVAPFDLSLINLGQGRADIVQYCKKLFDAGNEIGLEILYDDRDERPGIKFSEHDLIGLPLQIIIGARGFDDGKAEVKHRATGVTENIALDNLLDFLTKWLKGKKT